jgi:hypothetical protein
MSRTIRRLLFWLAVLIFAAASYISILYAQGYKYDFSQKVFVRTGAISVTVNTDAQLYINDRLAGDTSFLGNRVGQNKLLPGTYTIRLIRDGYSSWHKTAVVKEGLLTEFSHALLLPTDDAALPDLKQEIVKAMTATHTLADPTPTPSPTPTLTPGATITPRPRKSPTPVPAPIEVVADSFMLRGAALYRINRDPAEKIADGVIGFAVTSDGSRLMWFTRDELWVMWLSNTDEQPFHIAGEREQITRFTLPIVRAAWFRGGNHIVVDLDIGGYRVVEIDTRGGVNITKI